MATTGARGVRYGRTRRGGAGTDAVTAPASSAGRHADSRATPSPRRRPASPPPPPPPLTSPPPPPSQAPAAPAAAAEEAAADGRHAQRRNYVLTFLL